MKKALVFYLFLAHAIVCMESGPRFFLESVHNNTDAPLFLKNSNGAIELKPHSDNQLRQPLLTTLSNTNGFKQIICGQKEASEVGEKPKTYPYIANNSNEPSRFFSFSCIFQPVTKTDWNDIKHVSQSRLKTIKTHHTPSQRITKTTKQHYKDKIFALLLRIDLNNKDLSNTEVRVAPKASPASLLKQCLYQVLQFEQQQKVTINPEKLSQELNDLIARLKEFTKKL